LPLVPCCGADQPRSPLEVQDQVIRPAVPFEDRGIAEFVAPDPDVLRIKGIGQVGGEDGIAVRLGFPGDAEGDGKNPGQGIFGPVDDNGAAEKNQAAAFGVNGQSLSRLLPDRGPETDIAAAGIHGRITLTKRNPSAYLVKKTLNFRSSCLTSYPVLYYL